MWCFSAKTNHCTNTKNGIQTNSILNSEQPHTWDFYQSCKQKCSDANSLRSQMRKLISADTKICARSVSRRDTQQGCIWHIQSKSAPTKSLHPLKITSDIITTLQANWRPDVHPIEQKMFACTCVCWIAHKHGQTGRCTYLQWRLWMYKYPLRWHLAFNLALPGSRFV